MPCCKKKDDGKPKPPRPEMIKITKLLKYSSGRDKLIASIGVLFSIIAGLLSPAFAIVMGNGISIFDPTSSEEEVREKVQWLIEVVAILSSAIWATSYAQYAFMQHAAEKLSYDLREKYLRALMNQEISFFEKQQVEALPSKISEYFSAISLGLGEKFAQIIFSIGTGFGGVFIAFYSGPVYALMCFAYAPIFIGIITFFGRNTKINQGMKLD